MKSWYAIILALVNNFYDGKCSFVFSIYSYSGDYLTSVTVDGQSSMYNYSSSGDLTEVHFASGLRRKWTYNEMGLLNSSSAYNGDVFLASIGLSRSWNGKITVTTQPQNVTVELMYDTLGRVVSSASPGEVPVKELTSITTDSTVKTYLFGDQVSTLSDLQLVFHS